ncbi:MAG TPA: hypothetical protein VNN73_22505 [Blastocatellia bacterium]|nr:hypothetical protein [Blastocatellia bacterium]
MKKRFMLFVVVTVGFTLPFIAAAQAKRSQNVSLRVSLRGAIGDPATYNPLGDKIISDGRGDYIDGVDGVYAKFLVDVNNDFSMNLNQAKTSTPRYAYYNFSDQIYAGDGLYTAPWASYPQGFRSRFHIRHVYGLNADCSPSNLSFVCPAGETCGQDADGTHFMLTPGDTGELASGRDSYVLRFHEDNYSAVINHPCDTVYFKVYYFQSPERWVITPDTGVCTTADGVTHSGAIGTLTLTTGPSQFHNAGQYIMPFELTLTRK